MSRGQPVLQVLKLFCRNLREKEGMGRAAIMDIASITLVYLIPSLMILDVGDHLSSRLLFSFSPLQYVYKLLGSGTFSVLH